MVQEVISKGFHKCSQDEIRAAYVEVFGFALCITCKGLNWQNIYNQIEKKYNKVNNIILMPNQGKYIFNPMYSGTVAHYKGEVVTERTTDQRLLEIVFNQPMRKGLVIENPNYES